MSTKNSEMLVEGSLAVSNSYEFSMSGILLQYIGHAQKNMHEQCFHSLISSYTTTHHTEDDTLRSGLLTKNVDTSVSWSLCVNG